MRRARASAVAALLASAAAALAIEPAPRLYGGRPGVEQLTALGRAMFVDPGLSASGRLACATCHDPAAAFGPNARTPSPFADADPAHAGTRAIPSLRYAQFAGRFTEHAIDDEETHGGDGGPAGGLDLLDHGVRPLVHDPPLGHRLCLLVADSARLEVQPRPEHRVPRPAGIDPGQGCAPAAGPHNGDRSTPGLIQINSRTSGWGPNPMRSRSNSHEQG